MSRAVVISIRPKWCEKILSGLKRMEIRKTKPKLKLPFKCYIYCTLEGSNELFREVFRRDIAKWNRGRWYERKGKVIGEFICDKIHELAPINHAPDDVEQQACMSREEIIRYINGTGYAWHISGLFIYDTPRDLREFRSVCQNDLFCESCAMHSERTGYCGNRALYLQRAPQSWCYVEDANE